MQKVRSLLFAFGLISVLVPGAIAQNTDKSLTIGGSPQPLPSFQKLTTNNQQPPENEEERYRQEIQVSPKNAYAHERLGRLLVKLNRFTEAIDAYKQAIKFNKKGVSLYTELGGILERTNKIAEAIEIYRQAIRMNLCSKSYCIASIRYSIADLLYKNQEIEKSILEYYEASKTYYGSLGKPPEYYLKLTKLDPSNAYAYRNLAKSFLSEGNRSEEAILAYRKALQVNFSDNVTRGETYRELADLLQNTGKKKEALETYYQALRFGHDVDTYNNVRILLSTYDFDELNDVIKIYSQEVDIPQRAAVAYTILGMAFHDKSNYPNNFTRIFLRENFDRSDLKNSVSAYQKALDSDSNNGWANFMLGTALKNQNKLDESITSYRKAVNFFANSPNQKAWLHVLLGEALQGQKRFDKATVEYRQAIELNPNYAYAHKKLGSILLQQNKPEEALVSYQKASTIDPKEPSYINGANEARRNTLVKSNPELIVKDDRSYVPDLNEPINAILRSTVRVIRDGEYGTGWVVKRDGDTTWIITNRHVISGVQTGDNEEVQVELFSNVELEKKKRFSATVEKITQADDSLDLAVIKVVKLPDDIKPLKIKNGKPSLNQRIKVIGHPYHIGNWISVSGEVLKSEDSLLVINATTGTGNSGGPIINEQHQVIGLIVGARNPTDADPNSKLKSLSKSTATAGTAQAYPIDRVTAQLHAWNIL